MRWKLYVLLLAGSLLGTAQSSKSPASGETLYYNIEWRLITAGKLKLQWNTTQSGSRNGWHVNLHLESVGLVSKLFKVEDDYSALLSSDYCTESSYLTSHEGNRQRETRITFDAEAKKASYVERDQLKNTVLLRKETDIPPCVHDITGGLFVMRRLSLEPGQSTQVPVTDGKKSAMAKIEAQQREDVKTPAGSFKTVRYEAYLFNNVLYRRPAHLYVWLTDDQRKMPVQIRVRMPITIGTITLQLEKHE